MDAMDVEQEASKEKAEDNSGGTFKTPSFIIPSKKKVQSNTNASDAFKSPPVPVKPASKATGSADSLKSDNQENTETDGKDANTNIAQPVIKELTSTVIPPVKKTQKSPAEQVPLSHSSIPYKEPLFSATCHEKFSLEVIKNGSVIDNIDLNSKSFVIIGRLPSCDVTLEHPSLSRHHAVLQYSAGGTPEWPEGWYLFDLDSTHGTWINKNKVPSQKYHRLHVDYVLKFGGSTRLFILQGPDKDREEESELSASEMKEQREKQLKEAELLRQAEMEEIERKAELIKQREESKGCSWGIDDEEIEEDDENTENPFAAMEPENEALYINDPKKSLNGYFEREGLELPEYEFHDAGFGKWKCTIELPIDAPNGEPIVAEVVVSGKKREAVIACALEACRILDRHGELRKSAQESRKRKQRNWEDDDFYDSDEDVYLDRTGAIEKKRELRKEKIGRKEKAAETYDSLLEKHKSIESEIHEIENKLEQAKAQAAAMESEDVDALDAYMNAIKSGMMDTKTKLKFKRQLMELKQEEQKIRKLVNIAKPASLPELKPAAVNEEKSGVKKSSLLASTGRIKGGVSGNAKLPRKVVLENTSKKQKCVEDSTETVELEEEEEEEATVTNKATDNEKIDTGDSVSSDQTDVTKQTSQPVKLNQDKPKGRDKQGVVEVRESKSAEKMQIAEEPSRKSKGHSLPLAAVLQQLQGEVEVDEDGEIMYKDNQSKNMKSKKLSKKLKTSDSGGYNVEDPDYAVWLPPQNQTGDGKTHLNEKLGY